MSNVLNGGAAEGVVIDQQLDRPADSPALRAPATRRRCKARTVIANKIPWRDDKAALAIGPTGVALAKSGTLYVADTLENRIIAIPNALTRTTALADDNPSPSPQADSSSSRSASSWRRTATS